MIIQDTPAPSAAPAQSRSDVAIAPSEANSRLHESSVNHSNTGQEESQASQHNSKTAQHDHLTLSPEAEAMVKELQARDREVRAHEQAHMAAGAGLTGGATYSYQQGPDGQRYAVGGEVSIDTSTAAGDPETTIKNAETVRRAALAPSNPSAQDMAVAAAATQTITTAQAELARSESSANSSDDNSLKEDKVEEASDSTGTSQSDSTEAGNAQVEQHTAHRTIADADQADTHINLFA